MRLFAVVATMALICGALLFYVGLYPTPGEPNYGTAVFAGIIGVVIGALLASPVFLLRKNPKKEQLNQAASLKVSQTHEVSGLWNYRGRLVIDTHSVVFPNHCLFTDEPTFELTPMAIYQRVGSQTEVAVNLISGAIRHEYLPISKRWLEARARRGKLIQRVIWVLLLVALAVSVIGALVTGDVKYTGFIPMLFLFFVCSFAIPHLSEFSGNREISQAYFTDERTIVILNVHSEFLKRLPKLEPGFFHGFLGIQQLIEKQDRD